jgi:hypothetical protein
MGSDFYFWLLTVLQLAQVFGEAIGFVVPGSGRFSAANEPQRHNAASQRAVQPVGAGHAVSLKIIFVLGSSFDMSAFGQYDPTHYKRSVTVTEFDFASKPKGKML